MKTTILLGGVLAAACGKKDTAPASTTPPPDAAVIAKAAPPADAAKPTPSTIQVSAVHGLGVEGDVVIAVYAEGGWAVVDPKDLHFGDEHDHLLPVQVSPGPRVPFDQLALPKGVQVILFADVGTKVGAIAPAIAALGGRCSGLGVMTDVGLLQALALQPCTRDASDDDEEKVRLEVWSGTDKIVLAQTRIGETQEVTNPAQLVTALKELKASAFFTDRTDLDFAADDGATIADVVDLLEAFADVGFTDARWVPPLGLRVHIADGVGTGEPAAPPSVPLGGATDFGDDGLPRPSDHGDDRGPVLTYQAPEGDFTAVFTVEELSRVVKSRKGTLLACYKKQLLSKPDFGGTLVVSVDIDATGTVTATSIDPGRSSLQDAAVESCVKRQIQNLKFQAKGTATVTFPLVFAPK